MPKVEVVINQPISKVWDYFVDIKNWNSWYKDENHVDPDLEKGEEYIAMRRSFEKANERKPLFSEDIIRNVNLEWKEGAEIEWGLGLPSKISKFIPYELIKLEDRFMQTSYIFLQPTAEKTTIQWIRAPTGGAMFTDGGRSEQESMHKKLNKFKECVESSLVSDIPKSAGKTIASLEEISKTKSSYKRYSDIGPVVGTCSNCGREIYAMPGSILVMLSQSNDADATDKIRARATRCTRDGKLFCTGCAFDTGQKCPDCGTRVEW